jgi:hypothetical protein
MGAELCLVYTEILFLKTAVCMLLAVGFFMETAVTAYAQRWLDEQSDVIRPRDDTKNFFDIFNFDSGPGFRERRPYRDRPREDRRSDGDYRSDERESRGAEPQIIQVQKPKIEPKNPDASVVLVLGDTMAEQLALGLKDAYSKQPNLRIENVSVEGLGLRIRRWTILMAGKSAVSFTNTEAGCNRGVAWC